MEYVKIDPFDRPVSRVGLGTWAIGGWLWGGTDETQSVRTIQAALDQGINLIDTAPVYGFGKSEELVGKALKDSGSRDRAIIATKAGLEWRDGKIFRNSTKERIMKEVEDSLLRLDTDYIDLYQVHWPDRLVPFEETGEAMETLFRQGKIRAIGVSNYSPDQMEAFRAVARLHTLQPPYNLFEREAEEHVLPYCRRHQIHVLAYGVLCRGLLSGRMEPGTQFNGDDIRKIDPKFKMPSFEKYLNAVDALKRLAGQRYGKSVLELAVRWALGQEGISVVLWGARRQGQLDPVSRLWEWHLTKDDLNSVDRILKEFLPDPLGPEFMAPPSRSV